MRTYGRILNAFSEYFDRLEQQTEDDMLEKFDHRDKENWRYKLSKNSSLLNKAKNKYLGFSGDDGKVYTIPRTYATKEEKLIPIGTFPPKDG